MNDDEDPISFYPGNPCHVIYGVYSVLFFQWLIHRTKHGMLSNQATKSTVRQNMFLLADGSGQLFIIVLVGG